MKHFRIYHLETTVSTNDDVRRAADQGEAEGFVICAKTQTAGRGRQGRTWDSPEGNLYCSILLRPQTTKQDLGLYSFVAANAVYDTVRQCLPIAEISLKWPNDVLVEGEKIGGILLEVGQDYLVIGIGLNVLHHPEEALYPSTSLLAAGASEKPLEDILDMLLQNLWHWYEIIQQKGFVPVREAWLKHTQTGEVSVRLPGGAVRGVFAGLDMQGRLRLRLADGAEKAIATGDVFFGNP